MSKKILGLVVAVLVVLAVVVAVAHTSKPSGKLGASLETTTNLTALALSSDLSVSGTAQFGSSISSTGTSTLGYTPNQVNVISTAMSTGTTTVCSALNSSGLDRVVTRATVDLNGVPSSVTSTYTYGVTTTPSGVSTVAGKQFLGTTLFATSSFQQVITTSSLISPVWKNGEYATLISAATTTQTGNCVIQYQNF